MIERLIRWLARHEIGEAYEAGSIMARAMAVSEVQLARQIAYAQGECAGRNEAFEAVSDAIDSRMERALDLVVMPEDLARAKKGFLH